MRPHQEDVFEEFAAPTGARVWPTCSWGAWPSRSYAALRVPF